MAVTYDEARMWAYWLRTFTPRELAEMMAVPLELGERFCVALEFNGTVEPVGEYLNGNGPERLFSFVPLPAGPREHITLAPPERMVGYTEILSPRGMPVRLMDDVKRRNLMQGTGGARIRLRNAERAFQRQREAQELQAAKAKARERARHEDPKGKRQRDPSLPS